MNPSSWHFSLCILLTFFGVVPRASESRGEDEKPAGSDKHVVILAGPITGHPKNTHEYEKSAVLIKHLLDGSKIKGLRTTVVFDGWPSDARLLNSASTIVMISDGGDHKESNHPLYNANRFAELEKQMNRGCGLVQLHWSTFNPSRFHDRITEWVGGYFDYEKGTAANKWYSAIKHYTEPIRLGEPDHPISNGVKPFRVLEEFYYRIRFRDKDPRLKKIIMSKPTGENVEYAVGWAVERKDGGRGFGFTGGHYYMNWWDPNFRKTILNAVVWSAGIPVPPAGVQTRLPEPTRALIVTGHNHPAHDWRKTTAKLVQVVENDPRVLVDVTEDPEFLGSKSLEEYDVVIMNYSSWERDGLSEKSRQRFVDFLKNGGGLSIIHFANGSWTDTLPNKKSDWPEYRTRIVRRIWDHGSGKSGHDAFGNFRVTKTSMDHPITAGLRDFQTQDELYYRQQGPLPIEPLLTAVSRDTGQAEPMAWAYRYEKARIFQTVLGHADISILMASDLIRRGTVWAAGLENLSFDPPIERQAPYLWRSGAQWFPQASLKKAVPSGDGAGTPKPAPQLVKGKFGKALDARKGGVLGRGSTELQEPGLTVECWVKIDSTKSFNIIAASETKSSLRHWELYTYAGTGYLSVYMPGIFGEIKSTTNVCDGKWHYVAMTFEKQFVKLFVDGKLVKQQPINYRKHPATEEGFAIGSLVEKTIHCDGLIDELRVSKAVKKIDKMPTAPFETEKSTIGLWRFDDVSNEKKVRDQSTKKNDAAMLWQGVPAKQVNAETTGKPKKITGHWGEDAIGFRWTEKDSEDNRWAFTQHGKFLASTIPLPGGFAEKGLVIKVGPSEKASVCYDLKRLNLMAGWSDGFLEFNSARFGLIRHLKPAGKMLFFNHSGFGWNSDELDFHGLYPQGDRVLLHYSVGSTQVFESPWLERNEETFATVRDFQLGQITTKIQVPIVSSFEGGEAFESVVGNIQMRGFKRNGEFLVVALITDGRESMLTLQNNQVWLELNENKKPCRAKVLVWRGDKKKLEGFKNLISNSKLHDLSGLKKTGPRQWTSTIKTRGVLGEQTGWGYALDTIRLPFKNPYGSLFFVTGHDWLDNGDLVISTVHGEVWLAKNVDAKLENVVWHRFATGLYQPLGIRVVNNLVHVLCRDQIVRLHDRDANHEADYYECFHADVTTSTGVHDYVCCLETDQEGNFYYIHANDGIVRVSKDGKQKEILATGFRNPNGMGVRSDGLVTAAPQEGEWTPASAICEIIPGRHYGYRGPQKKSAESPLGYEKPAVFIPRLVDNSSGGQFWSETDHWGPLSQQLFHLSYGKCTMHLVLRDSVMPDDASQTASVQGAIVPLPFVFESGASRGRVSPHDGQVYVSGLKGWTTAAVRDGALQRVRYTQPGKSENIFFPSSYRVFANGIELGFTRPIEPASINQSSFSIQAWNYRYSKNYGSPEFKLSNPNQQGRDTWTVRSAKLSEDNHKVFLEIPQLVPADQVAIGLRLTGHQSNYEDTIYATIKQKRTQSISPGPPFNPAFATFQRQLKPGVYLQDLKWIKSSLNYYRHPAGITSSTSGEVAGKTPGSPTGGLQQLTWLKTESPQTLLKIVTGQNTSGQVKVNPLDEQITSKKVQLVKLEPNASVEFEVDSATGYCRLEVDLKTTDGPMQSRWYWKSSSFDWEPIPASAFFREQGWSQSDQMDSDLLGMESASQLIVENSCTKCHDFGVQSDIRHSRLHRHAPDLLNLRSRRSSDYVYRKILEPHFESHQSEMPVILDSANKTHVERAADLVEFLMSNGSAIPPGKNRFPKSPKSDKLGEELFEQLGCVGCHHLPLEDEEDKYHRLSLRYTAAKFSPQGLREFLLDPHRHSPFRKMGNFGLSKNEADALAQYIEKFSRQRVDDSSIGKFSGGNRERGRKWFTEMNCANCHQAESGQQKPKLVNWKRVDVGCLANGENSEVPDFALTQHEKTRIRRFLATLNGQRGKNESFHWNLEAEYPIWQQTRSAMNQLRCGTCHSGELVSASLPEIIIDESVSGRNPERLPNLENAGSKLHAEWLKKLFSGDAATRVRPWLSTRMPRFPRYSDLLAEGIVHQSGLSQLERDPAFQLQQDLVETGFQLTRPNGGLDCRQCHGVGDLPPRGDEKTQIVLGVNFSMVAGRLRREYYDRWMLNPLRIDSQTKMPKYSTDGQFTRVNEIYEGHARQQYQAIWHYLHAIRSD